MSGTPFRKAGREWHEAKIKEGPRHVASDPSGGGVQMDKDGVSIPSELGLSSALARLALAFLSTLGFGFLYGFH